MSTSSILLEIENLKLQQSTYAGSQGEKPDDQNSSNNYTSSSAVSSASGLSPSSMPENNYANLNIYEARPIRLGGEPVVKPPTGFLSHHHQFNLNSNKNLRDGYSNLNSSDDQTGLSDEYTTEMQFNPPEQNLKAKSPTCSSSSSGYSGSIRNHLLNYRKNEAASKLALHSQITNTINEGAEVNKSGKITCV